MRSKKLLYLICSVLLLLATAFTIKTWPFNFVGKITYRILGKRLPVTAGEDLANIQRFLFARRKISEKKFPEAQKELEKLRTKVSPDFIFFKEIYLYLGYIYDNQGQFKKEEDLYTELQGKDVVFSNFMKGLYYQRHGDKAKARGFFSEALKLDNRYHRLNDRYRGMINKLVADSPPKK